MIYKDLRGIYDKKIIELFNFVEIHAIIVE